MLRFYRNNNIFDGEDKSYINQMITTGDKIPKFDYNPKKQFNVINTKKTLPILKQPQETRKEIRENIIQREEKEKADLLRQEKIKKRVEGEIFKQEGLNYDIIIERLQPVLGREGPLRDLEGFAKAMKEDDKKIREKRNTN